MEFFRKDGLNTASHVYTFTMFTRLCFTQELRHRCCIYGVYENKNPRSCIYLHLVLRIKSTCIVIDSLLPLKCAIVLVIQSSLFTNDVLEAICFSLRRRLPFFQQKYPFTCQGRITVLLRQTGQMTRMLNSKIIRWIIQRTI